MSSFKEANSSEAPRAFGRGERGSDAKSDATCTTSCDLPDPAEIQATIARMISAYVQRRREGEDFPIVAREATGGEVTATDAVIAATALLDAVEVEIFELGMWKALGTLA